MGVSSSGQDPGFSRLYREFNSHHPYSHFPSIPSLGVGFIQESSSGRTPPFEGGDRGSNPFS